MIDRRGFFSLPAGILAASALERTLAAEPARKIVLRSSWQTVNIGDIAHTPGMLALLERLRPDDRVTLWPGRLDDAVRRLLIARFPRLQLAETPEAQRLALGECDFFLHGSGPGLVGAREAELARAAGKPYGFAGVTLSDEELSKHRSLLEAARFVYCRDGDSLAALRKAGISGPRNGFGPDATFALDLRDDPAADDLIREKRLVPGEFLCAVPRLRWTPYWEIHPERNKPNPDRSAVNEAFADRDHAKMRAAIVAWVERLGRRVLLVPEMTYAVSRLRPLLFDPLPDHVKPAVEVVDRYRLTAEVASLYARAAAVISFEMHSPIIAVSAGTPAILLRQPTDTRKGQMWRDIGLKDWIFEIDAAEGPAIADRLLQVGRDLPAARETTRKARDFASQRMAEMIAAIG
ncbi:MAG: polysaccharide pyruvyl transferase family protein [Isosphaeraceae bacterium]|nr:polysaccharide pyruvyl transferase family protein [Isosphaeraceae bacterium]